VAWPARSYDLNLLNFLLWDSEYKAEAESMYKRSRRCPKKGNRKPSVEAFNRSRTETCMHLQ